MLVTRRGVGPWDVEEPMPTGTYVEGPHPGMWAEWAADRWEPDTLDVMERFIKPDTTFVDLGASIGPLSLYAVALGARVVAVEPDPVAFQFLTRNGVTNAPGRINYVNAAVASYNGYCELTRHPQGWGQAMSSLHRYESTSFTLVNGGSRPYVEPERRRVNCYTVERIFTDYDIDNCSLVKMDIEGTEAYACEMAAPFLSSEGVPLLVEVHGPWLPRPMDLAWFSGFSEIIGEMVGFRRVLCVP